jgi:subtilisin family serine protease
MDVEMLKTASTVTLTLFLLSFVGSLAVAGSPSSQPQVDLSGWLAKVDPWVLEQSVKGDTEFIVYLSEQADLSAAARLRTKLEKGRYVHQTLTEVAKRTQKPLLDSLAHMRVEFRPYWVANMVWVRGGIDSIHAIAQRKDVAHLYSNPSVKMVVPATPFEQTSPSLVDAPEWNISLIHAPEVWAAGYTGQEAVVGGQDTGYEWNHPAIINQYRGWNGTVASHDYNWHDAIHEDNPLSPPGNFCGFDSTVPCDDDSHGTHTMGIMVGDDGAANQVGVAPGARWIGCRNMEENYGKPSTYAECYEWFIAPYPVGGDPFDGDPGMAPDVINNSWYCPTFEGCTDPNILLQVVNNVRAAGIVTVHSAGNSGPGCGTIDAPAGMYDASFTVGATDGADEIVFFSSRGPVTIDGSNRLKPDVSAPGYGVRSSVPGGGYGVKSGTSMAAPHVAGLVALLLSAQPGLSGDVDQIESIIEQSAVPKTTSQSCGAVSGANRPNNTYGWGRIDAVYTLMGTFFYFPVIYASP